MHTLILGGTGYLGTAITAALLRSGHRVTALVRSAASAERARAAGATPLRAEMTDRAAVRRAAAAADGVISAAIVAGTGAEVAAAERAATEAVLAGLGQRGAPFVRTGGLWVHGSGTVDEETPRNAPALVAWREPIDRAALAAPGVRSSLIEPGVVYGHGGGIPTVVVGAAVRDGALTLIGDGRQRWGTVHADDLAELYVLALERAAAGTVLIGASGENPTVRHLGEAASRRLGLGGRVLPVPAAEVRARLGEFGEALLLDQRATGARAKALGWRPTRPTLLEEIAAGRYPR